MERSPSIISFLLVFSMSVIIGISEDYFVDVHHVGESFPHGHSGKLLNQRFLPGLDICMLHILLTLLALLWLHQILFLAQECCSYLSSHDSRSLSCILLPSQALEYILVASGDVEENPGPTYFTGMFLMV